MVAPLNPPDVFATMTEALPKMHRDPKARELVQALSDREYLTGASLVKWLVRTVIDGSGEGASPELFAAWKASDIGDALHALATILVCPWPPVAIPFVSSLAVCLLATGAAALGSNSQAREQEYFAGRFSG